MSRSLEASSGPPFVVSMDPSGAFVLEGELDMATAPRLEEAIARGQTGGHALVLELSGLTFIDISGIRCLVGLALATHMPLFLRNPTPWVRKILHISGAETAGAWVIQEEC